MRRLWQLKVRAFCLKFENKEYKTYNFRFNVRISREKDLENAQGK
jgi:hypothetical protein